MGKIIVLGATGTLGLHIAKYLHTNGYDVFCTGYSNKKGKDFFSKLGIDYSDVDISDFNTFNTLPKDNVDCVINFAGCLPAMMNSTSNNTMYSDSIIRGIINILNYMVQVGCKKIIFPQSVYDLHHLFGTKKPIPVNEKSVNPIEGDHSIYVICKNAAIDIIKHYEYQYGITGIYLRLPGVYQYHPKPYILIDGKMRIKSERIIIKKVLLGEDIEIWGDPKRILESVCVEDFLQIIELCVKSSSAKGMYNVGNGGSTLEERVLAIKDVFSPEGTSSKVIYCPQKKDCVQYVLDISKTISELGYNPKYSFHDYLSNLKWNMENEPNKELWGSFKDYWDLIK